MTTLFLFFLAISGNVPDGEHAGWVSHGVWLEQAVPVRTGDVCTLRIWSGKINDPARPLASRNPWLVDLAYTPYPNVTATQTIIHKNMTDQTVPWQQWIKTFTVARGIDSAANPRLRLRCTTGAKLFDDVSLICDGTEMVSNGSFESPPRAVETDVQWPRGVDVWWHQSRPEHGNINPNCKHFPCDAGPPPPCTCQPVGCSCCLGGKCWP
jgi:hypothetical protein